MTYRFIGRAEVETMFDVFDESSDVIVSTVLLYQGLPHHFVLMAKLLNVFAHSDFCLRENDFCLADKMFKFI